MYAFMRFGVKLQKVSRLQDKVHRDVLQNRMLRRDC